MAIKNIAGQRFGRLVVISFEKLDRQQSAMWLCKCDCGNDIVTRSRSLTDGDSRSCGCARLEKTKTHGMHNTRTYRTWRAVFDRCTNPNVSGFHRYGGSGITVCERWEEFSNFYEDMGERPEGCTLDRIDNEKGYFKENCRWSTPKEQARNRGTNKLIETEFGLICFKEATEKYGIKYNTFHMRITNGWSIEKALKTPVRKRSK